MLNYAKAIRLVIAGVPPCLDLQSPLCIVISGNLVKRVRENKIATTKDILLTNACNNGRGVRGGLRVEPAMTETENPSGLFVITYLISTAKRRRLG